VRLYTTPYTQRFTLLHDVTLPSARAFFIIPRTIPAFHYIPPTSQNRKSPALNMTSRPICDTDSVYQRTLVHDSTGSERGKERKWKHNMILPASRLCLIHPFFFCSHDTHLPPPHHALTTTTTPPRTQTPRRTRKRSRRSTKGNTQRNQHSC